MNKSELVAILARNTELPKNQIDRILNSLLQSIKHSLFEGHTVKIAGFGSFERAFSPSRKKRNPKTGEAVLVLEHYKIKFKPGAEFKKLVKPTNK